MACHSNNLSSKELTALMSFRPFFLGVPLFCIRRMEEKEIFIPFDFLGFRYLCSV